MFSDRDGNSSAFVSMSPPRDKETELRKTYVPEVISEMITEITQRNALKMRP